MNARTKTGISIIAISWLTFIFGSLFGLHTQFAKWYCGDMYDVEPDLILRAQGILTDRACGFDSDMNIIAFIIILTFVGIYLIAFNKQ